MIHHARRGRLPAKPHTAFYDDDGALLHEHCVTSAGFDGPFSMLYHRRPPQAHGEGRLLAPLWAPREAAVPLASTPLRRRHLRSGAITAGGSALRRRVPLLFNTDLTLGVVAPTESDDALLCNGDGDDLFYVHSGGGVLHSVFGALRFGQGDYVFVPRGAVHRFELDAGAGAQRWLWFELRSGMRLPKQYRNEVGQLRMDAPYTARDFRLPELPARGAAEGDAQPTTVISKRADRFTAHRWAHSPLDVVGWDGALWPFAFPILSFSPKIGQVHLPPTVHGTFATAGSLICSFVPRNVDFHPAAIPCPYPHSNVDVDEVLFYCDGDFTSRRGIDAGSLSLHPAGVPHGPHPGAYAASIGTTRTDELAVMLDTFAPLQATAAAVAIEDAAYDESWAQPKEPT